MNKELDFFRIGSRPSQLARVQSKQVLKKLKAQWKKIDFQLYFISSIGDRDRTTDLRESPADFFTRELDDALLTKKIDLAIHSAKDLPEPLPKGIQTLYLPWREDPRDALVLPPEKTVADLPKNLVIGVSSDRRARYAKNRFPEARLEPIRGNIEERLAQLDRGDFDLILMAGAALIRLGLAERITEWIPLSKLEVPAGQGILVLTFRTNDARMNFLLNAFPLAGERILITTSEALQERASEAVLQRGGLPLPFPLIQAVPRNISLPSLSQYDWLILTSPSAVRCFLEKAYPIPTSLPRILSCGTGTSRELEQAGFHPEPLPEGTPFGSDSILRQARKKIKNGERVLRLRSEKAGSSLSEQLRKIGAQVDDFILYDTLSAPHAPLPSFDAVFFSSPSGVQVFQAQHTLTPLLKKTVVAIGKPTLHALQEAGVDHAQMPPQATVESAINLLQELNKGKK
jgi:hydroxymethylbilane synthase